MATVSQVEKVLFDAFPRDRAEGWDRPGLLVGNPSRDVTGVACALDVTPDAIRVASERGCNVLVTHHPAFLEPPVPVTPDVASSSLAGACVYQACERGVSLIAMHTNLDRSQAALDRIAHILDYPARGRVEMPDGYGALLDGGASTVSDVALRCSERLGRIPRIWGDPAAPAGRIGFFSGSLGSLGREALAAGCSCVIAGECGYHVTLDLEAAGLAVILVGHDVSELPFAGLLSEVIGDALPDIPVVVLREHVNWRTNAAGA